jgi:hypothetical protein
VAPAGPAGACARRRVALDLGHSPCRVDPVTGRGLQAERHWDSGSVVVGARRQPSRSAGGVQLRHLRVVCPDRHRHGQRPCVRRHRGVRSRRCSAIPRGPSPAPRPPSCHRLVASAASSSSLCGAALP